MDEINKLEEKVQRLVSLINELKQKIEVLEEEKSQSQSRDQVIKDRITGLIDKIDNLTI